MVIPTPKSDSHVIIPSRPGKNRCGVGWQALDAAMPEPARG